MLICILRQISSGKIALLKTWKSRSVMLYLYASGREKEGNAKITKMLVVAPLLSRKEKGPDAHLPVSDHRDGRTVQSDSTFTLSPSFHPLLDDMYPFCTPPSGPHACTCVNTPPQFVSVEISSQSAFPSFLGALCFMDHTSLRGPQTLRSIKGVELVSHLKHQPSMGVTWTTTAINPTHFHTQLPNPTSVIWPCS